MSSTSSAFFLKSLYPLVNSHWQWKSSHFLPEIYSSSNGACLIAMFICPGYIYIYIYIDIRISFLFFSFEVFPKNEIYHKIQATNIY